MIRKPIVAGQFYEADFDQLTKEIEECFRSERGPGDLPISKREKKLKAVIVPHAGYFFSGPAAAWAYKEIAEAQLPDLYIIIGPSHQGADTCISIDSFETPLGVVRADQAFGKALAAQAGIKMDPQAHQFEHSVEVQLPFLQYVNRKDIERLKILPILVSHATDYAELGRDIARALEENKRKAIIVVSSDFTHYGRNYHYIPFSLDVPKQLYDLDGKAIEYILKQDVQGFMDYVYKTGATICGQVGIGVLLSALRAEKVDLMMYYTSGDVINDYANAVGYASIVFR